MMTLFSTTLHRLRWLHTPMGILMVLVQRTPLLRAVASAGENSFGIGSSLLLRSTFAVTAMGAYHSLAGATKVVSTPVISKAPIAPAKGAVDIGSPLTLTVVPRSVLGVFYQWRLNNEFIYGATDPTYSVASVGSANTGSYTVTLTNLYGSTTSKPVVITVFNAPAMLPVGGTLTGTVNWTDSLAGPSNEIIDLDFAAKTIADANDPGSKITYSYKRTNSTTGVLTVTRVWTGKGKETETTKSTYTLVFGTYDAAAGAWQVSLTVSGSYSGKDALGKAYKGTLSGSGSVAFVKP